MKLLVGIAIGIGMCSIWPELPQQVALQLHTVAQSLADHTRPDLVDQGLEAWTDWRNSSD